MNELKGLDCRGQLGLCAFYSDKIIIKEGDNGYKITHLVSDFHLGTKYVGGLAYFITIYRNMTLKYAPSGSLNINLPQITVSYLCMTQFLSFDLANPGSSRDTTPLLL